MSQVAKNRQLYKEFKRRKKERKVKQSLTMNVFQEFRQIRRLETIKENSEFRKEYQQHDWDMACESKETIDAIPMTKEDPTGEKLVITVA